MYEIDSKLEQREKEGQNICVGLIGCGQMGGEIVCQVGLMKGMDIAIIAELNTHIAKQAYKEAGYDGEITYTDDVKEAFLSIKKSVPVITKNHHLVTSLSQIDAVIDATGSPELGAKIALECMDHKKHIIMMNVECDVTIGPILRKMAENVGIVYTLAAGDEPGSLVEIYRFAKSLGFTIVAAGKGKNNPLDIYASPEQWKQLAAERNMNANMLVEFVDGSKTMIEMAAVSNATGLTIDKQGMHGPRCNIENLTQVFSLKEQGGILETSGVVDYGIGDINPGVFVVITTKNQRLKKAMIQRDMGKGPNYLLLRPYHLCSCEVPISVAQAVFYNESTAHPQKQLISECITIAKKDLKKGQKLDVIGGFCYRASIEKASIANKNKMLPVGLAKNAILKQDIPVDTVITYDMVELPQSTLRNLRHLQDDMQINLKEKENETL